MDKQLNSCTGKLIVFEGIDGCGKTIQIRHLTGGAMVFSSASNLFNLARFASIQYWRLRDDL